MQRSERGYIGHEHGIAVYTLRYGCLRALIRTIVLQPGTHPKSSPLHTQLFWQQLSVLSFHDLYSLKDLPTPIMHSIFDNNIVILNLKLREEKRRNLPAGRMSINSHRDIK